MVCSIGQPYSKLINYAQENYVTRDETIKNSRWFGRGAESLGLSGRVQPSSYDNAYQGKDSNGNSLRRKLANKNSIPGRDLTFSAPKSVSLLALVEENKQIIDTHDRAVNSALEYIEQNCIYTRTGQGGSHHQITNNMVTAIFQHEDSRNLDPNLHSHCVVFNQTQGKDGKWRSMDNRELYQQQMTIGSVYHHELSKKLIEQGYSLDWKRDGTFDIAGISREQLERFSSRRTEIIDVAGVDSSSKQKAIACLSTRKNKQYISSAERKLLKDSWRIKYQQIIPHENLKSKEGHSLQKLGKEIYQSPRDVIDNSITLIGQENKSSFTKAELLRKSLIQSQGQHSLNAIQQEIKVHPDILPIGKNSFTTIDLYRENQRNREDTEQSHHQSPVLKLATATLTSPKDIATHQNKSSQEPNSKYKFLLKDVLDREQRISQSIDDYLQKSRNISQSRSIILTDNEQDKQILTTKVRDKLINESILSNKKIHSVILNSKKLNAQSITKIENYQPGNAIKFNRTSKRFSNRHFYKVLSVDAKNKTVLLGDRFGNKENLPIHRYQNRDIFRVERRELRVNEKLKFEKSQLINGKQVTAGQSFNITEIKDKQKITIKINNKLNIVKTNDLLFTQYNYVDTLEKCRKNKFDSCIYYPSAAKSSKLFQKDIYDVAQHIKKELIVYTSDNFRQQSPTKYIDSSPQKMNFDNQPQQQTVEKSDKSFIDISQTINIDNSLFELVSSSKYIVLNQDLDNPNPDRQVYHSPDGITIERDPQNLSIYYDGRSVQFDRDFNVTHNEFENKEINQLNKKTQEIKQEFIEHNRTKQIIRDIDLDMSR